MCKEAYGGERNANDDVTWKDNMHLYMVIDCKNLQTSLCMMEAVRTSAFNLVNREWPIYFHGYGMEWHFRTSGYGNTPQTFRFTEERYSWMD